MRLKSRSRRFQIAPSRLWPRIAQTRTIAVTRVGAVGIDRVWPRQIAGELLNAPNIQWRSLWLPLLPVCSFRPHGIPRNPRNRRHLKGGSHARTQSSPRYNSIARRPGPGASGSGADCRLTSAFNLVCSYGYYGYAPYSCAPMGYYGPGYFYNGIFLGMGPWGGWGYSHGWGGHRFSSEGGGRLSRRTWPRFLSRRAIGGAAERAMRGYAATICGRRRSASRRRTCSTSRGSDGGGQGHGGRRRWTGPRRRPSGSWRQRPRRRTPVNEVRRN